MHSDSVISLVFALLFGRISVKEAWFPATNLPLFLRNPSVISEIEAAELLP